MISQWHVDHGQSINRMPISERQLDLHITKSSFDNIKERLEEKKKVKEAAALDQARYETMKKENQDMVEKWENSIQNSLFRKIQKRKDKVTKEKLEKLEKYFKIKKEQEDKRRQYVEDAHRRMYQSKGYPYELNKAMLFSEILYERNQQKCFNDKLQLEEYRAKLEEARDVEKCSEQEKQERLEMLKKLQSKKLDCKNFYLKQILETEEKKSLERTQKEMEVIQKYKIMEHCDQLETLEKEKEAKTKQKLKLKLLEEACRKKAWEKKKKEEETETDLIIAIQKTARDNVSDLQKEREQELRDAIINRRIAVSEIVAQMEKKKYENEKGLLQKAIAEKEEIKKQQLAQKIEKNKKLKAQRLQYQIEAEKREKQRQVEESSAYEWEMQKKRLTNEYTKKYNKRKMDEQRKQILEYRKELQQQIEEKLNANEMEKEEAVANLQKLLNEMACDDRKFLEYAEDVLRLTESRGRPVLPIKNVIQKYKKKNMRLQQ